MVAIGGDTESSVGNGGFNLFYVVVILGRQIDYVGLSCLEAFQ